MKRMNLLSGMASLAGVMLMVACSTGVRYDISGSWKDGSGNMIRLNRIVSEDSIVAIDSAEIGADFLFALRGNVDGIQKMVLTYADNHKKEIIVDGEPLRVVFETETTGEGEKAK